MARDVPPLKILIEKLPSDAALCRIDEDGVDAAVRSAARYNRLTVEDTALYTLYANVNVISLGNYCVSNVSVEIYGYSTVAFGASAKFAKVMFCDKAGVGNFSKINAANGVYDFLKEGVDRCLTEL